MSDSFPDEWAMRFRLHRLVPTMARVALWGMPPGEIARFLRFHPPR